MSITQKTRVYDPIYSPKCATLFFSSYRGTNPRFLRRCASHRFCLSCIIWAIIMILLIFHFGEQKWIGNTRRSWTMRYGELPILWNLILQTSCSVFILRYYLYSIEIVHLVFLLWIDITHVMVTYFLVLCFLPLICVNLLR